MSYSTKSVYDFFESHVVYDTYAVTSFKEMYSLYEIFCQKQEQIPVSRILFSRLLFQHNFTEEFPFPKNGVFGEQEDPHLCEKYMKNKGVFIKNVRLCRARESFEDFSEKNSFRGPLSANQTGPEKRPSGSSHENNPVSALNAPFVSKTREGDRFGKTTEGLKQRCYRRFPDLSRKVVDRIVEVELNNLMEMLRVCPRVPSLNSVRSPRP